MYFAIFENIFLLSDTSSESKPGAEKRPKSHRRNKKRDQEGSLLSGSLLWKFSGTQACRPFFNFWFSRFFLKKSASSLTAQKINQNNLNIKAGNGAMYAARSQKWATVATAPTWTNGGWAGLAPTQPRTKKLATKSQKIVLYQYLVKLPRVNKKKGLFVESAYTKKIRIESAIKTTPNRLLGKDFRIA